MPRVSALTLSGGKLSKFGGHKNVRQYRVWVHHKKGGDDAYYVARSFKRIVAIYQKIRKDKRYIRVETPCAVVWDPKYRQFREVVIDIKPANWKP